MSSRPEPLFPLFADLETLQGVGPKTAQHLGALHISRPRDLIFTLPHSGVDRSPRESVQGALPGDVVTVEVTVGAHKAPRNRGGAYRVTVEDTQVAFQLVFFHARSNYLQSILPEGARRVISGKVEMFDGVVQMVHPDHILPLEEAAEIPAFEPVYPLTAGVSLKQMTKAVTSALGRVPDLPEWIDPEQKKREGWPDWHAAVTAAHGPEQATDL
ncbi:MAG: OB-fold nucleic acid binding domain-containing protein, partial [Pseudomonadota bacterium]|nr:OB-fold nucleic acid binding domain-containing protein [Pseudomonadota bacterium]